MIKVYFGTSACDHDVSSGRSSVVGHEIWIGDETFGRPYIYDLPGNCTEPTVPRYLGGNLRLSLYNRLVLLIILLPSLRL